MGIRDRELSQHREESIDIKEKIVGGCVVKAFYCFNT